MLGRKPSEHKLYSKQVGLDSSFVGLREACKAARTIEQLSTKAFENPAFDIGFASRKPTFYVFDVFILRSPLSVSLSLLVFLSLSLSLTLFFSPYIFLSLSLSLSLSLPLVVCLSIPLFIFNSLRLAVVMIVFYMSLRNAACVWFFTCCYCFSSFVSFSLSRVLSLSLSHSLFLYILLFLFFMCSDAAGPLIKRIPRTALKPSLSDLVSKTFFFI